MFCVLIALKTPIAFYPKRSYYGAPDYRCNHCGASFWWRERVKSQSAITKRRVIYNNSCKAGKVFVDPFKKLPQFLEPLLDYKGPPHSLRFLTKIPSTIACLLLHPWEQKILLFYPCFQLAFLLIVIVLLIKCRRNSYW